jgi:hypothetical protein
MIAARPNTEFEAALTGAATGQVGTLTVQIVDPPTSRVLVAPTSADIVEFPADSGVYTATLIAPDEEGAFLVVWSNGGAEDLIVSARAIDGIVLPEPSAAYATPQDVRDYTTNERVLMLDDETLTKHILQAEPFVDRAVGFVAKNSNTNRRFDPTRLTQENRTTLARATSAQVEYLVIMGDDHFTRPQFKRVSGPEFSYETADGGLPRIAPKVHDELAGSGILRLSTPWNGEGNAPSWYPFAYNVDYD